MANCQYELGDLARAKTYLTVCIALSPDSALFYYNRAYVRGARRGGGGLGRLRPGPGPRSDPGGRAGAADRLHRRNGRVEEAVADLEAALAAVRTPGLREQIVRSLRQVRGGNADESPPGQF